MSIDAMNWAMAIRVGKASYKTVLVALAHCHHSRTGDCHPTIPTLVRMTELNRKTIMPALSWLRDADLISFQKRNGASTNYTLNTDITSPSIGTALRCDLTENLASKSSPYFGTSPKNGTGPKNGHDQSQKRTKAVPELGHYKVGKYKELNNVGYLPLAEFMWERIQPITKSKKPPNMNSWANHIRLLVERDGREPEIVKQVFVWANQNSFWHSNILSSQKLREKFDSLFAQMGRDGNDEKIQLRGNSGAHAPKLTPAQRTAELRANIRRRELAEQSPDVGTVAAHE